MSPTPWADFRARLEAAALGVAVEWPNEVFQQPDAGAGALWLAIDATGDVLEPIEVGGGGWQEEGRVWVHVYAPAFTGADAARALAKQIASVYRFTGPNPTRYLGTAIGAGQIEEPAGVWWRLTVAVRYQYQDTAAG